MWVKKTVHNRLTKFFGEMLYFVWGWQKQKRDCLTSETAS